MKNSTIVFIVGFFAVSVAALFLLGSRFEENIDWRPNYRSTSTTPYGTKILIEQASAFFPGQPVHLVKYSPQYVLKGYYKNLYEYDMERLREMGSGQTTKIPLHNYVFISEYFSPGEEDSRAMLKFVEYGNNIFIASNNFYGYFTDTFKINTSNRISTAEDQGFSEDAEYRELISDSLHLNFTNPKLKAANAYSFRHKQARQYFTSFDTARSRVLARNEFGEPVFVAFRYGAGQVFMHANAEVFSNYNMMYRNNAEYIGKALTYLPNQPTLWDESLKPKGNFYDESLLRFIKDHPALRLAYSLLLMIVVFYIFLYGKRRQRIIPVIEPVTNSTVEFIKVIGNLYYQQKAHKSIATKQIEFLLEFIRNHYYLNADALGENFYQRLADKSGAPVNQIRDLFTYIRELQAKANISETELRTLYEEIEKFYFVCRREMQIADDKNKKETLEAEVIIPANKS